MQNLWEEVLDLVLDSEACMNRKSFDTTVSEIPALFPPVLGTANCTPYDMEQELSTSDELEDFEKISWHDRFL